MVIDRQRCVGCGSCSIACRAENNLSEGVYWSHKITETSGVFPNVRFHYLPTLCNHCTNAPCVRGCPTRAMHKLENGITMHDPEKCIGCRYCMINCPYGVIYFNWKDNHQYWKDEGAVIDGVTSSPAQMIRAAGGKGTPYYNPKNNSKAPDIRPKGVVEKCIFCEHRVREGLRPNCVEACPADARIFGDLEDPVSKVNQLMGKFRPYRLKEALGTDPAVFYIRDFSAATYPRTKGAV